LLNIGWVDFSKSDRDMVLTVLRQLSEPGALDELGIGTIRDAFADILFPGTSTIQTRAKYLYIIPYLCREIERMHPLRPPEFIAALEQAELDLIDVLDKNGAEGVIGSRSKAALRRKPSSIYWNALRTYGFFSAPITLSEYAAQSYSKQSMAHHQRASGRQRRQGDDEDTAADDWSVGQGDFWRVPFPPENWRDGLSIDLTRIEATDLFDKILAKSKTKDSLLALILRENRVDFPNYGTFSDLDGMMAIMPPDMRRDYGLARGFSNFIYGAQARYNVIYSEGQNEGANRLWEEYLAEKPNADLGAIQARLKPKASVMRFLKQFQASLSPYNEAHLDALIIKREIDLKTKARAKLTNKELYHYDGHQTVNMAPLTYRLPNVQRIVKDVFEGVGRVG